MLEDLPGRSADPVGGRRFEGVLTVVGDQPGLRGKRRLPTLFFGKAAMHADRDLDAVRNRVHRMARVAAEAVHTPTFLLTACRSGPHVGLYGRHVFNRAPYRLQLQRTGMEFAEDPVVTVDSGRGWVSESWGPIDPAFAVLSINEPDSPRARVISGARMLFHLGSFHLGPLTPQRLSLLTGASSAMRGIGAREPDMLVNHLGMSAPA